MKKILAILIVLIPFTSFAQYEDVAPGWTKDKDRILIIQKMDELIDKVGFEYDCHKSEISYQVTEKHLFYKMKKDNLHFPKKVTVRACRKTYYYRCECAPNAYGKPSEWIKGKWILESTAEEEE